MGSAVSYPTQNDVKMRRQILAIDISFTVIAVVAVILRFWARSKSAAGIALDDWLIVAALLLLFVNLALNVIMVVNGLGLQAALLAPEHLIEIAKDIFADEIIYVVNLALIKVSILIMYCRVFSLRSFRVGAWVLGTLTCCWSLIFVIVVLFQCTPIPKAWNPTIPGHCVYLRGTFIGNAVPNIITDVLILVMPVYNVWKLQVRLAQRISLTGIFLLGCFVIVASVYRFYTILKLDQNNLSYTLKNPTTWSHVEVTAALVSASLPTMRPLLTGFMRVVGMSSSRGQTNGSISRTPGISSQSGNFTPAKFKAWPERTNISNDEIPLNSIKVETDMQQTVEHDSWRHEG